MQAAERKAGPLTMRKTVLFVATVGLLAACQPSVPESGVGFGDYADYVRARERALETGAPAPMAPAVTTPGAPAPGAPLGTAPAGGFSVAGAAAAIDAADGTAPAASPTAPVTAAPLTATAAPAPATFDPNDPNRPRGNAPAGIREESGEMAAVNNGGISDEQDFGAVASRETIESDAERIARNKAQYTVVAPTALPTRTGPSGPNIVEFALTTTHAPGTPVYRRSGLGIGTPMAKCGRYPSADLAQEAFLENGGPDRDREGLDPDGDGFACGWDPRPFRTAQQ
jgi:hypothetical protein